LTDPHVRRPEQILLRSMDGQVGVIQIVEVVARALHDLNLSRSVGPAASRRGSSGEARRHFVGCRVSFCTRQFNSSPTNNSLSLRQSIAFTVPNSFGIFPARPNLPRIRPSSSSL